MNAVNVTLSWIDPEQAGDLSLPVYATAQAAGMDVRAAITAPLVLEPGDIKLIPCGFAVALPEGFEMQVRPRSGLAIKHGVTVINAPGTIDADYRGEIMVGLINHGRTSFTVRRGDRIAQLVLAPVVRALWTVQEELEPTGRGSGGFGHTGLQQVDQPGPGTEAP